MNPLNLQLENFCSHSYSNIVLEGWESAVIIGKITDNDKLSNGSGKSTIFGAFRYVFFNEIDFSTLDKIIRVGENSCKVTCDFIAPDKNTYRIARSRNRKTGSEVRLFKKNNDTWEDLTQRRNSDTEAEIAKIIKINYTTFCNTVLFAQGDLNGLAKFTPGDRKRLLKEILQLGVYSKYEALAKKKASDIFKNIEKQRIVLSTLGDPKADIKVIDQETKDLDQNIATSKDTISASKTTSEKLYNEYVKLVSDLKTIENQAQETISKKTNIQKELNLLLSNINGFKKRCTDLKTSKKTILEDIEKQKKDVSELLISQEKRITEQDLKLYIAQKEEELINCKGQISSLNAELKALSIPIPNDSVCNYCRQEITDEIRSSCKKDIQDKKLEVSNTLTTLKTKEQLFTKELSNLKTELTLRQQIDNQIRHKNNDISYNEKDLELKRIQYTEYFTDLETNKKLYLEKEELLKNLPEPATQGNELKPQILYLKNTLSQITAEQKDIEKDLQVLSNNRAILDHKLQQKTADIKRSQLISEDLVKLEADFAIFTKVVQAFSASGIPALISHNILDAFQMETNNILNFIRPGLQLQFSVIKEKNDGEKDDTLDIKFFLNSNELEYAQLSGAQKLIISLALKLGLATIVKNKLGIDIKFLLIDEIDQSLDEAGVEVFEDIIKKLQSSFKIMVITHNNSLKDKFKNVILVEQNRDFVSTAKLITGLN